MSWQGCWRRVDASAQPHPAAVVATPLLQYLLLSKTGDQLACLLPVSCYSWTLAVLSNAIMQELTCLPEVSGCSTPGQPGHNELYDSACGCLHPQQPVASHAGQDKQGGCRSCWR